MRARPRLRGGPTVPAPPAQGRGEQRQDAQGRQRRPPSGVAGGLGGRRVAVILAGIAAVVRTGPVCRPAIAAIAAAGGPASSTWARAASSSAARQWFIGPTGTGESHLAKALGPRACRLGMSVRFVPAHAPFAQLRAAPGDGTHARRRQRLIELQLLIVDDLGLRPLCGEEPSDLHELVRARHERRSTIFTSNRAVPEWQPLFPDPPLPAATMDRLLQHAHVIELVAQSYRHPRPGTGAAGWACAEGGPGVDQLGPPRPRAGEPEPGRASGLAGGAVGVGV